MRTRILLGLGALLVFGVVNWQMAGKERLRGAGKVVYLELAPVDPRSLMQGDYMALNFRLARQITWDQAAPMVAVVKLDPRRVGEFAHLDVGNPLDSDEVRFRFRMRHDAVWLGTNAFFFHEGEEERYRGAKFGEFRVNDAGDAMLVDLRDQNLQTMSNRPIGLPTN